MTTTPASVHVCLDRTLTLAVLDGVESPNFSVLTLAVFDEGAWTLELRHAPGREECVIAAMVVVCDIDGNVIHWEQLHELTVIESVGSTATITKTVR